ncbi:MAG: hypothetical protein PHO96_05565, partial [Candidatus Izemoplasmatales bacterium]|nr:hypothetical protein [Candidatus Izemoplasmatales bacterium]
ILVGELDADSMTAYDITITNSSVSGNNSNGVGALVGYAKTSPNLNLSNIHISNTAITNAARSVGTLIGVIDGSTVTVTNVFADTLVVKTLHSDGRAGGLVGEIKNSATVNMSQAVLVNMVTEGAKQSSAVVGYQATATTHVSDIYYEGTIKCAAGAGQVSGYNNLTSVTNVFMVDVVLDGAASYARQTVASEYVIDSTVTTIDQAWWTTNLSAIANDPLWVYSDGIYALDRS